MYHSHWGLKESPYRDRLDPRFFYQSPIHEEALARMQFLVDEHRRLGLLLGGSGTGKSLLLEVFARMLRRAGRMAASVDLLGLDGRELLWQIAAAWGVAADARDDAFQLWRRVTDRVIECRLQRQPCMLLLDNADEAQDQVLLDVLRLASCDLSNDNRLTMIIAARPDQLRRLGPRLLDLASLRIDLTPWEEIDTVGYLNASLARVGRERPAFGQNAMARLHELSAGVPRRVNQLADLCLLAGAGSGLSQIDPATVDSAYEELAIRSPGR